MEFFTKTKAVKLRSHLYKYLIADYDQESVRQTRHGLSRKAVVWLVELVDGKSHVIRLKNCYGKYLTASDLPFLLGVTGKKILQTVPGNITDSWKMEWEPIRDGSQLKLKSWCGSFLRANGGAPPWRNAVTHDEPPTGSTQQWIFWDIEVVEAPENDSLVDYLSSMSSFSTVPDDVLVAISGDYNISGPSSQLSIVPAARTPRLTMAKSMFPRLFSSPNNKTNSYHFRSGMDFFLKAKTVRLRSHHDKYLLAEDDEESVSQDRNGSPKTARWTVEPVPGSDSIIRLKSCYGKYLTASNQHFLLGMTGRKVLQTVPRRLDSSVEWEPVREGGQVKLKTRYGNFLRANGGLPPWRNSVTHDIPHRSATLDWILWDVDVVENRVLQSLTGHAHYLQKIVSHSDSLDFESTSPPSISIKSGDYLGQGKSDGRTIYYHVADKSTVVDDDANEGCSLNFKGNGVDELTQKLKEDTGLEDIVVCTRSPLNGELYPLRLQLPPNNADMHVILVQPSSKAARDFAEQGTPV